MTITTTMAAERRGTLKLMIQIAAVVLLIPVGLTIGGLTGWPVMSPILGMLAPLLAATWMLRSEGMRWRDVGFGNAMPVGRFLKMLTITVVVAYAAFIALLGVLKAIGLPEHDVSALRALLEGNTVAYLLFLIPVSWGSAAFGEEMLLRGFMLNRLERLSRSTSWAVVGQAAIFASAHFYQGITGVLLIFAVGLVFGAMFIRSGRNLWPVIAAHGVIDTIAMTALYAGWG